MRRWARAVMVLVVAAAVALPLSAAERWWESYNRGVAAVRAKNYEAGADALQRAVAEMPVENGAARARNEIITYVPHFWLGIARFNLGDVDGALREWKTSEDQGVVQSTPYFSQLRDWEARARSEKQRRSETAAGDSKREANAAVGRAVSAQMDAVAAGADRSDGYRAAQRKLQEAMSANAKGGTEIRAFQKVAELATQSRDLFVNAAEDAKKQRASRAPAVARQNPPIAQPAAAPPVSAQVVATKVQPPPVPPAAATQPAGTAQPAPPIAAVESEELVSARMALQQYRRHLIELHRPTDDVTRWERALTSHAGGKAIRDVLEKVALKERELARVSKSLEVTSSRLDGQGRDQLQSAYRAFAAGDFAGSEKQFSRILATSENAEAYLLRGCARYTHAMLSRERDTLLAGAANDFRAALKLNRALRLERSSFSPKLIAYFEQLRKSS
ncbi:MAG: hypothetical protein ABIP63_03240 [Thermoanaerobaculia bacterium]